MLKVDNIITPEKFISLAHNCVSERRNTGINLTPEKNIFFVKLDYINEFIYNILPKINFKFILITHDSDIPVTQQHISILQHPYLIKWFGMNCHIIHEKLNPIPIGIANECWPHGDKQSLLDAANEVTDKQGLVYSNFSKETNINERSGVNDIVNRILPLSIEKAPLTYRDYLKKLSSFKFVISPPGNSVDCHRVWESIYVGTIPIVLKSIPMVYFKDCPILFINEWEDLKSINLDEKYKEIITRKKYKSDFTFYKKIIQDLALAV